MRRRDLLPLILLATALPLPASADEKKKKISGGENYLPIEAINGATNQARGRRGVLSVDCGLQIEDAKLRSYAEMSMPRLRAAYVQVIQIYAAGLPSGSEPNVEFIVQALQRQTDLILKRPGARLLVGAVVAH
jgi:hypothetical protein